MTSEEHNLQKKNTIPCAIYVVNVHVSCLHSNLIFKGLLFNLSVFLLSTYIIYIGINNYVLLISIVITEF